MTQLETFIENLRKLAKEAPQTLLVMPPNNVGLPEGAYVPKFLLEYLADCLEANV